MFFVNGLDFAHPPIETEAATTKNYDCTHYNRSIKTTPGRLLRLAQAETAIL